MKRNSWVWLLGAACWCAFPAIARSDAPGFDAWWHDGRAELDGYRLTVHRYGQPRVGQGVMIFVTEPFSKSRLVKVDDPSRQPEDVADVLKLNFVRDFQTGIYDYNTMVSLFMNSADFTPMKSTFSSAEWCGHVYEEQSFWPYGILQRVSSYFEGESGDKKLEWPAGGITEEGWLVRLRGLRGEFLKPGESLRGALLPSAFHRRLAHQPTQWDSVEVSREARPVALRVPAGVFQAIVYRLRLDAGRSWTVWVESKYPGRILKWESKGSPAKDGPRLEGTDSGELTGSARLQYWKLHDNGQESYLRALGLQPTVKRR